jgi:hypothetical protein
MNCPLPLLYFRHIYCAYRAYAQWMTRHIIPLTITKFYVDILIGQFAPPRWLIDETVAYFSTFAYIKIRRKTTWTRISVNAANLVPFSRAADIRDNTDVIIRDRVVIHITGFRDVFIQEDGVILLNTSMTFQKSRYRSPDARKWRDIGFPKAPVNEIAAPADGKRTVLRIGFSGRVPEIFQNTFFIPGPAHRLVQFCLRK